MNPDTTATNAIATSMITVGGWRSSAQSVLYRLAYITYTHSKI